MGKRLHGPNVKRSDESYRDALLPGVLEDCLRRINPKAHSAALAEAMRKISDVEGVDLLSRNILLGFGGSWLRPPVLAHFETVGIMPFLSFEFLCSDHPDW